MLDFFCEYASNRKYISAGHTEVFGDTPSVLMRLFPNAERPDGSLGFNLSEYAISDCYISLLMWGYFKASIIVDESTKKSPGFDDSVNRFYERIISQISMFANKKGFRMPPTYRHMSSVERKGKIDFFVCVDPNDPETIVLTEHSVHLNKTGRGWSSHSVVEIRDW
jgi:hypothetical protein